MSENSIGTQPIHIRYSLNDDTNTSQLLSRDMIHIPDETKSDETKPQHEQKKTTTSEYPYFTNKSRIPLSRILKLPREEQVNVFFDKKKFKRMIEKSHKSSNLEEQNQNAEYNIKLLLNILLPTSFPIKNNLHDTFNENIKEIISKTVDTDKSFISKLFEKDKSEFAYINSGGSTHTVTKITWVNDIINDPIFNTFLNSTHSFFEWKKSKQKDITAKIKSTEKALLSEITAHFKQIIDTLTDPESNAYTDYTNLVIKSNSAANRGTVRASLMEPHFTTLKKTNLTDINTIVKQFVDLHNLTVLSPVPNYIPVTIKELDGFNSIMKNSVMYTTLSNVLKNVENIQLLKDNLKLSKDEIKKLSDTDTRTITEVKKFTQFTEFMKTYEKLRAPYRQYTNPALSQLFKESSHNLDELVNFVTFIQGMSNEDTKPLDKYYTNTVMINRLQTGVMTVIDAKDSKSESDVLLVNSTKYYDVNVHLETVLGEITDANLDDIKCPYRNNMLNQQYNKLQFSEENNPVLLHRESNKFDMGKTQTKRSNKTSRKVGGKKNKTRRCVRGGFPKVKPPRKSRSIFKKYIKSI